jgi:hypothetical protein
LMSLELVPPPAPPPLPATSYTATQILNTERGKGGCPLAVGVGGGADSNESKKARPSLQIKF